WRRRAARVAGGASVPVPEGADGGVGVAAIIHDFENPMRLGLLGPVESDAPALFVDRVLPDDLTLDVYASGEYEPVVSWASEPVTADVRTTGEAVELTCRARGLEKRRRFAAGGGLTVTYRWDAAGLPAAAWFAPEISLAHPLELTCTPETDVWSFPIATVSKSERGLDETVQGRSLTPRWP